MAFTPSTCPATCCISSKNRWERTTTTSAPAARILGTTSRSAVTGSSRATVGATRAAWAPSPSTKSGDTTPVMPTRMPATFLSTHSRGPWSAASASDGRLPSRTLALTHANRERLQDVAALGGDRPTAEDRRDLQLIGQVVAVAHKQARSGLHAPSLLVAD